MKIKTELPTESGLYWWRENPGNEWSAIEVQKYDDGTSFYPIGRYVKWFGRTLTVWMERHPIGFWARIQTPDEAASDPVVMAVVRALEILNDTSDHLETRSVAKAVLRSGLEATK